MLITKIQLGKFEDLPGFIHRFMQWTALPSGSELYAVEGF